MVMHSMVIILLIKTIQKKLKKKKKNYSTGAVLLFLFCFHILVWSIAVPVANDVAQLACLLRCLPPEQYVVTILIKNDRNTWNSDIDVHESDGFIVLIKQICRCVMYCSGHLLPCSPPPAHAPPCPHADFLSYTHTTCLENQVKL